MTHFIYIHVQWNLYNPTPEFSDILWHPTKIYGPKVFLLIKIRPEYSDILYNPTHFPGPLVCQIRQVPLYIEYQQFWRPRQTLSLVSQESDKMSCDEIMYETIVMTDTYFSLVNVTVFTLLKGCHFCNQKVPL